MFFKLMGRIILPLSRLGIIQASFVSALASLVGLGHDVRIAPLKTDAQHSEINRNLTKRIIRSHVVSELSCACN